MKDTQVLIMNGGTGKHTYAMNSSTKVLNMNGGTGKESYAMNSSTQRKAIAFVKPVIEEAIKDVYCKLLPKTLCISDLGCSSGSNSLYTMSLLMEAVDNIRKNLGRESPEFLINLNDLPSNDFNTIFQFLSKYQEDLKEHMGSGFGHCFVTGVPGSFFERLFPSQSLHFVHSSYSLHWLSHAPEGVEGNKGNIYISSTSPSNVPEAYLKQFTKDFSTFLRCRAAEVIVGGRMVLTIIGRRPEDELWGPLSKTIKDMVNEGLIEEEKLDSFNLPIYHPLVSELKDVIEKERSFTISRVELADVSWKVDHDDHELSTHDLKKNDGLNAAKGLRAACEPMLASHFGEDIMDDLFSRYAETLGNGMSEENTTNHNVILSLRKKD